MADNSYKRTFRTSERPLPDEGAPAPESAPDPLVELARLIGQNDPFAFDQGASSRRESRTTSPAVEREDVAAPRLPEPTPIPRRSTGRAEATNPRHDDHLPARTGAARDAWAPDDRRRAAAFDEPLQQIAEPLPRSYSEPMYPHAEQQAGAVDPRMADPRRNERYAPAPEAYRPAPDPRLDLADPAEAPGYAASEQDYPDLSDDPGAHAYPPEYSEYAEAGQHGYQADPEGAYQAGRYPADAHAGYHNEGDADYEEPRPDRRKKLLMVIAVAALAVFGTAGAYGFRSMGTRAAPSAPPVIRADNAPNKVAWASQSGDANKQIYERLSGQDERMVSREEQPVDARGLVPGVAPAFPEASVGAPVAVPVQSATGPRAAAALPLSPPPTAAAPQAAEPKRIRTVTIKPDQQGTTSTAPAPAPRAPVRPAGTAPLSLNPQGVPSTEPAPAPRPQVALASPPPPAPRAVEGGNWVVQLSAQKSEGEAQASFRAMQTKYPGVLGGQKPLIRKKDLGPKGVYYGAQVGPFTSRDEAANLCESLKSAGGTCIVQKN